MAPLEGQNLNEIIEFVKTIHPGAIVATHCISKLCHIITNTLGVKPGPYIEFLLLGDWQLKREKEKALMLAEVEVYKKLMMDRLTDLDNLTKEAIIDDYTRNLHQNSKKRRNVDSFMKFVLGNIISQEKDSNSHEPINEYKVEEIFETVEKLSEEELQAMWAKLFVEELIEPEKYSLRTIEFLKRISPYEAKIFKKVGKYALINYNSFFGKTIENRAFLLLDPTGKEINQGSFGFTYSDITLLKEIGLIKSENLSFKLAPHAKITLSDNPSALGSMNIRYNTTTLYFQFSYPQDVPLTNIVMFSKIGTELLALEGFKEVDQKYIDHIQKEINNIYPNAFMRLITNDKK